MSAKTKPTSHDDGSLQVAMVQLKELIASLEAMGMSVAVAHLQAALDNCEANKES